jgi:hypothetical protein
MQFSPASCHFISLRSKYSFQHPVLKHPRHLQMFWLLLQYSWKEQYARRFAVKCFL